MEELSYQVNDDVVQFMKLKMEEAIESIPKDERTLRKVLSKFYSAIMESVYGNTLLDMTLDEINSMDGELAEIYMASVIDNSKLLGIYPEALVEALKP